MVVTRAFTLGAVRLTQRYARQNRADDRAAADIAKIEEAARQLVNAVSSLQIVLVQSVPLWNSWQPKLAVLGSAFLEFTAASKSGGLEQGLLQAIRTTVARQAQELPGLDRYRVSFERIAAALAAVAVLPDEEIHAAGLTIDEAIGKSGQAYGTDSFWRPKRDAALRLKPTINWRRLSQICCEWWTTGELLPLCVIDLFSSVTSSGFEGCPTRTKLHTGYQ